MAAFMFFSGRGVGLAVMKEYEIYNYVEIHLKCRLCLIYFGEPKDIIL